LTQSVVTAHTDAMIQTQIISDVDAKQTMILMMNQTFSLLCCQMVFSLKVIVEQLLFVSAQCYIGNGAYTN